MRIIDVSQKIITYTESAKTSRIIIISVLFYRIKSMSSLDRVNIICVCPSEDSPITRHWSRGHVPNVSLLLPPPLICCDRGSYTGSGFPDVTWARCSLCTTCTNQTTRKRRTNTREGGMGSCSRSCSLVISKRWLMMASQWRVLVVLLLLLFCLCYRPLTSPVTRITYLPVHTGYTVTRFVSSTPPVVFPWSVLATRNTRTNVNLSIHPIR